MTRLNLGVLNPKARTLGNGMISKDQVKETIEKKNKELLPQGMKIGVHEKDINKGHIGLGCYVSDNSRLFVQLAMKKIGISEELLPKGFLEDRDVDEKGDHPGWEWGNFVGLMASLLITLYLGKREYSKTKIKNKKRQKRFDTEMGQI